MKKLQSNVEMQIQTRTIIIELKDNLTFISEAENAEWEFINTGDTAYLQLYNKAVEKSKQSFSQLHSLFSNKAEQQQQLSKLYTLVERKIELTDKCIALKKNNEIENLRNFITSRTSLYLMESIKTTNRFMQESEQIQFNKRASVTTNSLKNAKNIFIIGFVLSLLIISFLINTLLSELTKRTVAEQELQITNDELDKKNKHLQAQTNFIKENEIRIEGIINVLIKTTQLDFSEKLNLSDKSDELDAIAVGLNTMSEELEYHLRQLQGSEKKLNDAQRLAKIGNWEFDMVSNKVQWSDEMYNLYGYGNDRFALTYEKATERMLQEDREKTQVRMKRNTEDAQQLFKDTGIKEYESPAVSYTLVMPDGTLKVVEGIGKIILNNHGEVIKMVGTVQDIDQQYRAEQKLNAYNIELERKNKEIEQFAYAASHDLQEPLRSISNFSNLLAEKLKENKDPEIQEYMNLVSGGAARMSSLIFDLLEYSRAGKDMEKRKTNCNKLVEEIVTDLATIINETGALINIQPLPTLESYDLKSVFQNLIVNAIKFRKKDHVPVVTISAIEKAKEYLFTINDNGIGIEKEYYNRIFIIFQRLHKRTKYAGTGIGLSLTKKIVEKHGGRIWIESQFGEGTTFYFTIPKK